MTDLNNRKFIGKSLMLLIIINVVLNIGVVSAQNLGSAIRKLKLEFMKWKQLRIINKQRAKQLYKAYISALRNKIKLKDA